MPSPDLMTKREVAARLGVVPSTVNRMVSSGRLKPASTVPGPNRVAMYLFRKSDVERLAARRSPQPVAS